jgi:hypothetical protein
MFEESSEDPLTFRKEWSEWLGFSKGRVGWVGRRCLFRN